LASRIGGRAISTASRPRCFTRLPRSLTASLSSLFARFLTTALPSLALVENANRLGCSSAVGRTFNMKSLWTYVLPSANTILKSRLLASLCCLDSTSPSAPSDSLITLPNCSYRNLLRYRQSVSALGAASLKHISPALAGHSRQEPVNASASSNFGLVRLFHESCCPPICIIIA